MIKLFAGLKGSISPEIVYRADVSFSVVKDLYLFVNDTNPASPLQNTFLVDYDDANIIQYHGALAYEHSTKWNATADFSYYSYSMTEEKKPWHKPQYELTLNAVYNLKEKFLIHGGLIVTGERFAKVSSIVDPKGFIELEPVADINLGVDYLFSKLFTVFLTINNLTNNSYLLWNQYPSQGFNFMIGFSYKL